MKTREELDLEIQELKNRIDSLEGTKTEVYSRIVGYYRSLHNWNKGKREEYNYRKTFVPETEVQAQQKSAVTASMIEHPVHANPGAANAEIELTAGTGTVLHPEAVSYAFFYRQHCPNCPPVKSFIESLPLTGHMVDADTSEGLAKATEHQVLSAPTVVFFNQKKKEVFRASSVSTLKEVFKVSQKL